VRLLQMLGPPEHEGELQKIATAATAQVTAWNKRAARGGPRETWRRRRAGALPAAASEFRRVSARSCMLSVSESSRLATAAAAAALPPSSRSPRMVSTISVTRGAERAGDIGLAEKPVLGERDEQPVRKRDLPAGPRAGPAMLGTNPCGQLTGTADILREKGTAVSAKDKAKDKAEAAKGKVKKGAGKALGSPTLEAKGKAKQAKGNLKQAGEKAKDAAKK